MAKKRKKYTRRNVEWFIDKHYELKQERDELLAEVKEVKQEIAKIEGEALERFGKEGIQGAKGDSATGYIEERDHYNIADRRKFEAYIKRTGFLELFQGRVSAESYRELVEQGYKPAGVSIYTETYFRTRKR